MYKHIPGSLGVGPGKSTLIERYLSGRYAAALAATSGVDTKAKAFVLKG